MSTAGERGRNDGSKQGKEGLVKKFLKNFFPRGEKKNVELLLLYLSCAYLESSPRVVPDVDDDLLVPHDGPVATAVYVNVHPRGPAVATAVYVNVRPRGPAVATAMYVNARPTGPACWFSP